jgi:hypothetical protein
MDRSGAHLNDWPQAASFDAHDYRVSYGPVYIVPEFSVIG